MEKIHRTFLANPIDGLGTRISSPDEKWATCQFIASEVQIHSSLPVCYRARLSAFCSAVSMLRCFVSRRDIERSGPLSRFCMQFIIVTLVASAVWWVCVRRPLLFYLTTRSQSLDDTTSLAWVQSSLCSRHPLLTGAHSSPLTLLCAHRHLQLAHTPESQRPWAACAFVPSHSSCSLWAIAQGSSLHSHEIASWFPRDWISSGWGNPVNFHTTHWLQSYLPQQGWKPKLGQGTLSSIFVLS